MFKYIKGSFQMINNHFRPVTLSVCIYFSAVSSIFIVLLRVEAKGSGRGNVYVKWGHIYIEIFVSIRVTKCIFLLF